MTDVDGNAESRKGTVSVFNGPAPIIYVTASESDECDKVSAWLKDLVQQGVTPPEIGIFVRSDREVARAVQVASAAGLTYKILDEHVETKAGHASICTMHLAKGLEFRAVVVMACDDEIIPSQDRIESVADESDLEEVYNTERHLLYVACTRARDHLLVSAVGPGSEFLEDFRG